MSTEHESDAPMPREVLDQWEAMEPPAGFADRVMQAHAARSSQRRWPVVAVTSVVAAAAVVAFMVRTPSQRAEGAVEVATRTTVPVGRRAVAVAEAGAALKWRVLDDGTAELDQPRGQIFYRVNAPGSFTIHTPAGDVSVHGTCFTVEVPPMVSVRDAVAGALVGAAVVVTVYEGKVSLANAAGHTELGPGEQGRIEGTKAPTRAAAPHVTAAAMPISVENGGDGPRQQPPAAQAELAMARVQVAALQTQVQQMQKELQEARAQLSVPKRGKGPHEEMSSFFEPTKEELIKMAQQCRVQMDVPAILQSKPPTLKGDRAESWGLQPEEVDVVNRTFSEFHKETDTWLRAMYVEVTGDTENAKYLSPFALVQEIEEHIASDLRNATMQKISMERAGLAQAPADLGQVSVGERFFRRFSQLGDRFESALADELGAERAHQLRAAKDGWPGNRFSFSGCPEQ